MINILPRQSVHLSYRCVPITNNYAHLVLYVRSLLSSEVLRMNALGLFRETQKKLSF